MRVTDNMVKWARRIQSVIMGFVLIIVCCSEPHIMTFIIMLILAIPFFICRVIENIWEDQEDYPEERRRPNGRNKRAV